MFIVYGCAMDQKNDNRDTWRQVSNTVEGGRRPWIILVITTNLSQFLDKYSNTSTRSSTQHCKKDRRSKVIAVFV